VLKSFLKKKSPLNVSGSDIIDQSLLNQGAHRILEDEHEQEGDESDFENRFV